MKRYLPFALYIFFFLNGAGNASAQYITSTVAGNGVSGYSGDGGPATAAKLSNAVYTAIDNAGNIYITDQNNNRIRKVSASGTITTIAGNGAPGYSGDGGAATDARINHPYGVAVDGTGNIYIADNGNNVIRKVTPAGIISTFAGTAGPGLSAGDGGPATDAHFNYPDGIKIDASGNIFVVDAGSSHIRVINTAGIAYCVAGNSSGGPTVDGVPATATSLSTLSDVALDASGNLYISDRDNQRIRKVNTSGIISTIAGTGVSGFSGDGGPATAARINSPVGITTDAAGNIYFDDGLNYRIRKISTSGTITTIAGTGVAGISGDECTPATASQFYTMGLNAGNNGDLYVATSWGVREIHNSHTPLFAAGHVQYPHVCKNTPLGLNAFLSVTDTDKLQPETWGVVTPPAHGELVATYATTSTGSILVPAGLSYTPATGYAGNDTVKISVADCIHKADTISLYITVDTFPVTGAIVGPDSVCPAHTVLLFAPGAGGDWATSNPFVATVSATGSVYGVFPGSATISYTLANSCSIAITTTPLTVRPLALCAENVGPIPNNSPETLTIYPNPIQNGQFTLFISSPVAGEASVNITNLLGQVVQAFRVNTNTETHIDIGFPDGIYFLSATTPYSTLCIKIKK